MMTLSRARFLRGAACLALAGAAPHAGPAARADDRDGVNLFTADGGFERFLTLCQRADVAADPFTVFAPTNAAFGRTPESLIADLAGIGGECMLNMVWLRGWGLFDVVQGRHPSAGWTNMQEVQTINRGRLRVDLPQDEPMRLLTASNPMLSTGRFGAGELPANRIAAIRSPDLMTSNGIVHGIDNVLLPWPWTGPVTRARPRAALQV
jgi:hypothetical protein